MGVPLAAIRSFTFYLYLFTDDLLPSSPVSCLPSCRMDPKVLRLNILISVVLSQDLVDLGRPTGLLQSVGGLSAACTEYV